MSETKHKIRIIFDGAEKNGVEILVLSAFGCGAFMNDPVLMSQSFKDVMEEDKYINYCKKAKIVFSIYKDPQSLSAFQATFNLNKFPAVRKGLEVNDIETSFKKL